MAETSVEALRRRLYDLAQEIGALEQQLALPAPPDDDLFDRLAERRAALAATERAVAEAEAAERGKAQRALTRSGSFSAEIKVHLAPVPTGFYHLLERESRPLVTCTVKDLEAGEARVAVAAWLEGYSAQDVQTVELGMGRPKPVKLLPTLFPERVHQLSELTRAALHVVVTNLGEGRVMLHRTEAVWLLARNSAPRTLTDPATGEAVDVTPYLGAFVTPHAPAVLKFLHKAAALHPERRLAGTHAASDGQAQAIYEALQKEAGITYVTTVLDINPDPGAKSQRVRLPRESLREKVANCVDGAVLFASLLEAISLNPALVAVPGHMLVSWEDKPGSAAWRYLETTMLGCKDFAAALNYGSRLAAAYEKQAQATGNPELFRRWPVRELRTQFNIWPME